LRADNAYEAEMNKTIIRLISGIMLASYFASTTGISILHHLCECHPAVKVSLLPGLIEHTSDCCCASGVSDHKLLVHSSSCSLSEKEHCKDIKVYLKADIVAISSDLKTEPCKKNLPAVFYSSLMMSLSKTLLRSSPYRLQTKSPPLSSKSRIIFLHQIKTLPADPYVC